MGNVGLPGTGLGGLLYLVLALAMPAAELVRTVRGEGTAAGRRLALGQFTLACGIVASVAGTLVVLSHVLDLPGPSGGLVLLGPAAALLVLALLVVVLRVWAGLLPRGRHVADRA